MWINPDADEDELSAFVQCVNEDRDTFWFAELTVRARRAQFRLISGGKQDGIGSGSPPNAINRRGRP